MSYREQLLAQDESIRLIAHRHVLFLVVNTMPLVLAALLLWAAAYLSNTFIPTIGGWAALLFLIGSLVPLGVAAYRFLMWRSEEYIITNYRIIQVEGFLSRRTFDSALEKVNDVLMTQTVLGRMFGYGTLEIITGSDIGVNNLAGIAEPFTFKRELLESKMELGDSDRPSHRRRRNVGDPVRLLAALSELRDSGVITTEEYESRRQSVLQQRLTDEAP